MIGSKKGPENPDGRHETSAMKYVALAVAIAAMFIAAGWQYLGTYSPDQEANYRFADVKRAKLTISTVATGRIKAVDSVEVSSQLSGQVVKLYADFNDKVTSGALLAQLDDKTFQAAVAESRARLAHAKASHTSSLAKIQGALARYEEAREDYQRKSVLRKGGGVSAQALDKARADMLATESELNATRADKAVQAAMVEEAEAALSKAQIDLARTTIRSPIDGTVIKRTIELGQTVAATMKAPELFTIARDLDHMQVHARVDEADIGRIGVGQSVRFSVDAYPDRTFAGRVVDIHRAPEIVQNVVTYAVVITAENPDFALLPGMTAIVHIVTTEQPDTLLVPNAALRFEPGTKPLEPSNEAGGAVRQQGRLGHVWVRGNTGVLTRKEISVGKSDGNVTEVISGPLSQEVAVAVGTRPARSQKTLFGIRLGF